MNLEEILTAQGVSSESVTAIVAAMAQNNIYTTTETNVEQRLSKFKEERDTARKELADATKLVTDLQDTVKGNEEALKQIDDYKQQAEAAQAERVSLEKTYSVKEALTKAGAKDVDYAIFKLGGVDKLELNEDGTVKDLDNKVKELQESMPDYFDKAEEQKPEDDKADDKGGNEWQPLDNKLQDGQEKPLDPFQAQIEQYTK
jgi:hypothetical protein